MLNKNPSGNTSEILSSFRKKRQQRGAFLLYGSIGLVVLGLIVLIVWLTIGSNAPLTGLFATDTPTPTLTFTPTNTSTPSATPTITETPTETPTATQSGPVPYTIQDGDSLDAIAQKFGLGDEGVLLLLDANPSILENNGVIFVGQSIIIPPPGTSRATTTPIPANLTKGTKIDYRVLPGDTLAGIAAKFNSTQDEILKANTIDNPNALSVGQILQIPVNVVTPTATLPPTSTPITPTVPGQSASTATNAGGSSVTGTPVAGAQCAYSESVSFVTALQNLINDERTAKNLAVLTVNQKLAAAAKAHAIDMLCNNYLSHIGLNGSTPETRVKAQGYSATIVFENLFALSPANGGSPSAAFNWWLNDAVQRSQVLNTQTTDFGVAYVSSPDSLLGGYFVVISARP